VTAGAGSTAASTVGPENHAGRAPGAARIWLLALLGWTTVASFYDLRGGARFEPIDCWVAQTAREMLDAGEWIVPRFSGETRIQKSPGPYWAVMAVSLLCGTPVDEYTARVPNALAAVGLVATIFWLTRRIAGERAAVFAGFAAASSILVLWWSHRSASDLGLTAFTTFSLAALWVGLECEPPGRRQTALVLAGYAAAGLGMLWKMPMPVVVVGLPALLYVVLLWRWRVLANRWHLVGLLLFLLPWVPWVVAVCRVEHIALAKWKVEYVDRFTGDLPNVKDQQAWWFLLTYFIAAGLFCLPYTLSLPAALVRAGRRQPGVDRRGTLFAALWFVGLFVFFTASRGKEWRYLLPAIPPLFVLLGIELAAFFDPQRPISRGRLWTFAVTLWVVLPIALLGGGLGLHTWYQYRGAAELEGLADWSDVLHAYAVAAAIVAAGMGYAVWLYVRNRRQASFGLVVATMWLMWGWVWPKIMPLVMSQRPYVEFARQLADPRVVPPGQRYALRQVGTQDSRIIWYSDLRFPRLIDQLALLREQHGRRDLEYEIRRYGSEMVRALEDESPVLLVARLTDYYLFRLRAPAELARQGRTLPRHYVWLQSRYGRENSHFVLIGNKPPPWPPLELRLPEKWKARLAAADAAAAQAAAASQSTERE